MCIRPKAGKDIPFREDAAEPTRCGFRSLQSSSAADATLIVIRVDVIPMIVIREIVTRIIVTRMIVIREPIRGPGDTLTTAIPMIVTREPGDTRMTVIPTRAIPIHRAVAATTTSA